jgi:hypothetical protein
MDARTDEKAPENGIYTEAQVAAIDTAIARAASTTHPEIREKRPDGLTLHDQSILIGFANTYKLSRGSGISPGGVMPSRTEKHLKRIALQCDELSTSLRSIKNVDVAEALEHGIIRYIEVVGNWAKMTLKVNHVLHKSLPKLLNRTDVPKAWLTPRAQYYSGLLALWVHIGGDLKFSRNRQTRRLQGPLIEFLEAAASPALGPEALKNTSLQHIIDLVKQGLVEGISDEPRH